MIAAKIRAAAVACYVRNIGYGETTANNAGAFIEAIGGRPGYEWCALLAGHGYRVASDEHDLEPPPWLFRHSLLGKNTGHAEAGARELCRQLAKVAPGNYWAGGLAIRGERFTDVTRAVSGDLMLWKRPGGHHVAPIEHVDGGICRTIEGNVGRFPAKTKRLAHDPAKEPHFVAFFGLRDSQIL